MLVYNDHVLNHHIFHVVIQSHDILHYNHTFQLHSCTYIIIISKILQVFQSTLLFLTKSRIVLVSIQIYDRRVEK